MWWCDKNAPALADNCSILWNIDALGIFDDYARNVAIIIMLNDNIGTPKDSVWIISTKNSQKDADKNKIER